MERDHVLGMGGVSIFFYGHRDYNMYERNKISIWYKLPFHKAFHVNDESNIGFHTIIVLDIYK
jgi:hypothetical protein